MRHVHSIPGKYFIGTLPAKQDFKLRLCSLADQICRNRGGVSYRTIEVPNNLRQKLHDIGSHFNFVVVSLEMPGHSSRILGIVCRLFELGIFRPVCNGVRLSLAPLFFVLRARIELESNPPLRNTPTGTSLIKCRSTARCKIERSSSTAVFSAFGCRD